MSKKLTVPLCDVKSQYQQLQVEIQEAITRVLASGQVILGPEVAALEKEVAQYCGAGYGIGCSSGSDALLLALRALDLGPGDEVIVPPFTFFATVGAICRAGAKPVFTDIEASTYNIDPQQIEDKITPATRAIMVVHLYGQCADMEPLWSIAERHNLVIIEDAAQALGAAYHQKRTGTLGAMACFSFYPSKNLGAVGDAGIVVTSDPDWAAEATRLRVHGMEPKYVHQSLGWNARIDALQAAVLRVKLPHLDTWTEARRTAAKRYDALIDEMQLGELVERPVIEEGRYHVFNQYVIRVAGGRRDDLMQYLRSENIGCEIYYPIPLHMQQCFADLGYREGDFPISEAASRNVIALPIYPELSAEQQYRVVEACAEFLRQNVRRAA